MADVEELKGKLVYAESRLMAAQAAKADADRLSAAAREMGGGLLSFGTSGPQRAKNRVQGAQGRAFEAHRDADARIEKWTYKIRALQRQIEEAGRPRFGVDDVAGARYVRTRTGWHKVVKVNKKTVTVETGYTFTDLIPLERILEVRA